MKRPKKLPTSVVEVGETLLGYMVGLGGGFAQVEFAKAGQAQDNPSELKRGKEFGRTHGAGRVSRNPCNDLPYGGPCRLASCDRNGCGMPIILVVGDAAAASYPTKRRISKNRVIENKKNGHFLFFRISGNRHLSQARRLRQPTRQWRWCLFPVRFWPLRSIWRFGRYPPDVSPPGWHCPWLRDRWARFR